LNYQSINQPILSSSARR